MRTDFRRAVVNLCWRSVVMMIIPASLTAQESYSPHIAKNYPDAVYWGDTTLTGGEVLAIPHNSNLSNGRMFELKNFQGKPFTREYAQIRARWEPLLEATQIKGDSETHPLLSPGDEFSDYERWNNWNGWPFPKVIDEAWREKKKFEYARSALKLGLDRQAALGVNPFKFGLVGGTDGHTSIPSAEEDSFWGKMSNKDPDGASLDRIQLIKGWRDAQGGLHEKIYNVALSDDRKESPDGKAPPVGNTVNVATATYTNSIGDAELATVWSDPDFNPKELALYYLRILQIPTPRWTTHDAAFFKADLPRKVPAVIQERAYTSPIWYTP